MLARVALAATYRDAVSFRLCLSRARGTFTTVRCGRVAHIDLSYIEQPRLFVGAFSSRVKLMGTAAAGPAVASGTK